jgi:hypothetical protein
MSFKDRLRLFVFNLYELVRGREKAVAAFLAPIIVAQLARFVPGVHVGVSLVEQVIAAVITSAAVHQTTNTGA